MTRNKLHYVFGLCLLIIGFLLMLSWVKPFAIGAWRVKKVDLLADVRVTAPDTAFAELDSLQRDSTFQKVDSLAKVARRGCPVGITCIEDYSPDSTGIRNFVRALSRIKDKHSAVRIAFYGDSFIEGDVFCGSLRDTLQSVFGGEGVGYVPLTSEVAGFRTTIKHQFENWKTYSLISKKDSTVTVELGPVGFSFVPQEENWVEYKPTHHRFLKTFNTIKLYYKNQGHASVEYTLNDTITSTEELKTSNKLQEWTHKGKNIEAVRLAFLQPDSLNLFGASFEAREGVYVDNFSMRGNSGIGLYKIDDDMYTDFNRYRDYKLIILQYGLNVVLEDSMNYGRYAHGMIKVVNKLKSVYPKASILLVSVSDRSSNTSGEYKTMKAIPIMRNAQRLVAERTGIVFWDLYEAMGGENSMVKMTEGKPALAAKDYTHLNFKGGRRLSGRMAKSLLYELEKYNKHKKN
ncbi:MAG TPA: hypothetical protein VIU12_13505 [Chryseolinea sp.]